MDLLDETRNKILGAANYEAFRKALAGFSCAACELSKGRTQIVVDRGEPSARVVLIGEAPGKNEDLQGRAFVGRAGRLLDGMMREAGFDPDKDGLIVNVVKCRPPDNRAPKEEEVNACRAFLKKQIELVKPKIIVLLGATALKHLVAEKAGFSMKSQVGRFFEDTSFPGMRLIVFYHPAYILRDPRKKPEMAGHIRTFMSEWSRTGGVV